MKKLFLINCLFLSAVLNAQTNIATPVQLDTINAESYQDAMNLTFGLLPKNHLKTDYLFSKATVLDKYRFANGLLNDSSFNMLEWYFTQNIIRNSYKTPDSLLGYLQIDSIKNSIVDKHNILSWGIINIEGDYILDSAFIDGSITVDNYRLKENTSYLNKIYNQMKLFCVAPLNMEISTFNPQFIIKPEFIFSNDSCNITKIEIDLDDGLGYKTVEININFQANYTGSGFKNIITRIINRCGDTLYSRSELHVNDSDVLNKIASNYLNYNFKYIVYPDMAQWPSEFTQSNGNAHAEVGVWWGCGNASGEVRKPYVIFAGYNPKDGKSLEYNGYPDWLNDNAGAVMSNALGGWRGPLYETYNGWYTDASKNKSGSGDNTTRFLDKLRTEGYDVFIVRFMDGIGYLQHNAHLVNLVLNDINNRINNSLYVYNPGAAADPEAVGYPNTTQLKKPKHELIVAGYSAGALSSRLGLLLMENKREKAKLTCLDVTKFANHRTRIWVGMDCENQGSNTPIGFQMFMDFQRSVSFLPANIADVFNSLICGQALSLLKHNGVATQNTLYHIDNKYVESNGLNYNNWKVGHHSDFEGYFQDLSNLSAFNPSNLKGYPKNCFRIAVSQGNANGVYQKINSEFDLIHNESPSSFCLSSAGTMLGYGNWLLKITPFREATARVLTTWNNNAFSRRIGISIKTLFWTWHLNIGYGIYKKNNYVTDQYSNTHQPYDVFPASTLPTHQILGKKLPLSYENPIINAVTFCNSKSFSGNLHGFSPTISGLDVHYPNNNTLPRLPNLSLVPGNVAGGLNLMKQNNYPNATNNASPNGEFGFPHLTFTTNHYDYTPFDAIWANNTDNENHDPNTIHVEDPNPNIANFLVEEIAPPNLYLSNRTIEGEHYTCTNQNVTEKYYADFEARNSVLLGNQTIYENRSLEYERVRTSQGDFVVGNGGVVTVRANNGDGNSTVTLGAGFSSKHGSIFRAYVYGDTYLPFGACNPFGYKTANNNQPMQRAQTVYTKPRPISSKRVASNLLNKTANVNVSLFPNPTNGSINYIIKNNEVFTYTIYDIMGKLMQTGELNEAVNSINLFNFDKGIYLITIKNSNYLQTDRIILQ